MISVDKIRATLGGRGGKYHCPAHNDANPSLSVDEGCAGKILVKCRAGCPQDKVIAALRSRGLWDNGAAHNTGNRKMSDLEHKLAREDADLRKSWEEIEQLREGWALLFSVAREHRRNKAQGLSNLKTYLAGRGIEIVPPGAMFASASLMRRLTGIGFPAMVLPVVNSTDAPLQGGQATFLTQDCIANAKDKNGKSVRRIFGVKKGGYIRLIPPAPDQPCIVAEGIEKGLAAAQIAGVPAIALLGKPTPDEVTTTVPPCSEVIVSADNDGDGGGLQYGKELAARLAVPGRDARITRPPKDFKDWDDLLLANRTPAELEEFSE